MLITADLLRALGVHAPTPWVAPLSAACTEHDITTPARIAPFLANVLWETTMLRALTESMDYDADSLLRQWPSHFGAQQAREIGRSKGRPADQRAIAETVYAQRFGNGPSGSGDGWLFRGHGGFMTTFRANYQAFAEAIGWRDALEMLPAYLETVPGACFSAAEFWTSHGCNELADRGDLATIRQRISGSVVRLPNVRLLQAAVFAALRGQADVLADPAGAPMEAALSKTVTVVGPPRTDREPPSEAVEHMATVTLNDQAYVDALNQRQHS